MPPLSSMTASGVDLSPQPRSTTGTKPRIYAPLSQRQAQAYAGRIVEWIAPRCLQIEMVGELRRQCRTCERVDLLVVPQRGTDRANVLFDWLDDYVQNSEGRAQWQHETGRPDLKGWQPPHPALSGTISLPKCVLTIHCTTPQLWFLRLFETTGTQGHSADIASRIKALPGVWKPGESIQVRGRNIIPACEGQIYELVKMSWVAPWRRLP
jgi:hypothetical protein